jgi:hypothetical protein
MHSSVWTYLKRAMTVALIVGPMLALVSVDVEARGGGRGGGPPHAGRGGGGGFGGGGGPAYRAPRANVGGGGGYGVRPPPQGGSVHVDVDRHWGYGGVGVGAAVAVGTAVAVGAMVSTLPPNCTTIIANGIAYRNCGGTYYVPSYDGPNVVYEVVPAPSGWNQ